LGLAGKLPFATLQIGGWWQANEEIDLIAVGQKDALLVECKLMLWESIGWRKR
jgi:hypothetical protein